MFYIVGLIPVTQKFQTIFFIRKVFKILLTFVYKPI